MAMIGKKRTTLKFVKGDKNFFNLLLADYFPGRKSTGIHAEFATSAPVETLGTAIAGASDYAFYGYGGQHQAVDIAVRDASKNDTVGDSIAASFTVMGTHPTTNAKMTASLFIPSCDATKIDTIATALKGLDWYTDEAVPVKLTGIQVKYSNVV